ncbi:plasmid stabilization protein [Candidatus Magnetobacterium bavaricum]|uniref:Plasmid stabilization protein n=1 Tax=Candidatus Magnetobacterium bavaricum TaxID=29290 RepID=A0A0F3GTV5_9BACT|nr:plasmid stabilization protein [Candidatus Magnetobacterium bavaricum]
MLKLKLEKSFVRKISKIIKHSSAIEDKLSKTFNLLQQDPFNPLLKTHPLAGFLKGLYSCSLTHNIRIVFKLNNDIVHLVNIGTHDEVYKKIL